MDLVNPMTFQILYDPRNKIVAAIIRIAQTGNKSNFFCLIIISVEKIGIKTRDASIGSHASS